MRRMFSENQIKAIVNGAIAQALPENFDADMEWVEGLKEKIFYDDEEGMTILDFDTAITFDMLFNGTDGLSLENILEAKADANPTDLSNIEETFASSPTGNQLPNSDQSSLSQAQLEALREKMLYWIKQGYIKDGSIYRINRYYIGDDFINIDVVLPICDNTGAVTTLSQFLVMLDIINSAYSYSYTEI